MGLAVDLVHADRAYLSAVRIKEPGGRTPRYLVAFDRGRTACAWPLGSGAVLAFGDRGQIAVCDFAGGAVTSEAQTESYASVVLSSDQARLYVYNGYKLEIRAVATLTRLAAYDSIVMDPDGTHRLAGGHVWVEKATLPAGHDARRLRIYDGYKPAIVEHTDGRLLVVTFDDESARPGGILIIDPATAAVEWLPRSAIAKLSSWIRWLFGPRSAAPDIERALRRHFAAADEWWNNRNGKRPYSPPIKDPQAEIFVDRFITHRVELPDLSAASVVAALDDMATRIERHGLQSMLRAEELDFTFEVGASTLREREFFGALVDCGMTEAVPALRRLLTAYHAGFDGGEGSQPRNGYLSEQPTGALAHAMRALLFLDRGSIDIFRTYIAKRDGEHEQFATETLFPEFVAREGLETEDDVRLAVAVALNIIWGGRGPEEAVWRDHGLIEIARNRLGADRFAAVVTDEVKALDLEPQWDFQDSQGAYYLRTLLDAVPPGEPFGDDLRRALARRWPSFADAIMSYAGRR